jgi:hypothetical protein
MKKTNLNLVDRGLLSAATFIFFVQSAFAQGSGAAGISTATTEIKTYIDPLGNLMLAIGAAVGIFGAIRCYIKWQNGDQDTQKSIMGWAGSCIFLVVSGVVIKAFFGV